MAVIIRTGHRLQRDSLGLSQIIASTLANIAPAMSFFFGFGVIVVRRRRRCPADHPARHGGHPVSDQHAGGILEIPPQHRLLRDFHRHGLRPHRRCCGLRHRGRRLLHRRLFGRRHLRRLGAQHVATLPWRQHPLAGAQCARHRHRRACWCRAASASRPLGRRSSSISSWCCWSSAPSSCWSSTMPRSAGRHCCRRAYRADWPVSAQAFRSPSTYSSAGKTQPCWRRKPQTRDAMCHAP